MCIVTFCMCMALVILYIVVLHAGFTVRLPYNRHV